jgi:hypothetical protein
MAGGRMGFRPAPYKKEPPEGRLKWEKLVAGTTLRELTGSVAA